MITAKQISKDILNLTEHVANVADARSPGSAQTRVPEPIVQVPLLRVAEHRVRLRAGLECLLGLGVVGVAIRMMLESLVAVGLLELGHSDFASDFEDFVIIRLRHRVFGVLGGCNISMLAPWSRSASIHEKTGRFGSILRAGPLDGSRQDIADEGVGQLTRTLERAHVQDRLAAKVGSRASADLLRVLARLEGDQV